ncbi:hypothetical protein [Halorubrum trapanicum]|uniref:hypothetical protein n=1 Tax=Halorubrum trapanicum TaxID=29284 RepID=UPI003C6F8152
MERDPRNTESDQRLLRRRRVLGAAGVGLTAAIAGCGSSEDGGDDSDGSTEESSGDDSDGETSDGSDESDGADGEDGADDSDEEEEEEVEPASFEVVSVDHPDEVSTGEEHTFSFTVENTGGEDGTFEEQLEFSLEGSDQWENIGTIQLDVAAGETETWESNPTAFDQAGSLQFRLGDTEWGYDVTITAPETQSFSGSGQEVRQGISIQGGLTVVRATHSGESNFQVSLANDSEFNDNFINVIGDFDGAQADLIKEGEYILEVNADGNWEIDLEQPRSGEGESLPTSFSGSSPDVVGPVQFGGTGVAIGEHDGESNFQVQIYPMTGSFGEVVFNEIGSFEGETTYSFDTIGWVDINADGNWSVELE